MKIPAREYRKLPDTPGVYLMYGAGRRLLYVGKAGNLRRRVASYFERPHDLRIEALVAKIESIEHRKTDTALEALILEARLIKEFRPPFNVREKDDKSFLYVAFTREPFPRPRLVRGKELVSGKVFGPFTSSSSVREALRILRRIFPWSDHEPGEIGRAARPCLNYEIGLCPGTCVGIVTRAEYARTIGRLRMFFEGKKKSIIQSLVREMGEASKKWDFERAERVRRQIFALQHIRDTALISDSEIVLAENATSYRIEGYDISNISGSSAVGAMVVFEDGKPSKNEYRKFRIRTITRPNDVGMLAEVLSRRFRRGAGSAGAVDVERWRLPDLVLIDGGVPQANAARRVLLRAGLGRIPVVGIAKGRERKRNDIIGAIPRGVEKATLVRVRDEAHRFAIGYHKALRRRALIPD